MTEADEIPFEDDDDDEAVGPRKFHWAMLPAMIFNLFAGLSQAWMQFFAEISGSFFAHSTFKTEEYRRKEEAKRFEASIEDTIARL